jgi:uncharacterized protein HemY
LERKDIKKIDRLLEELEKNPLDAKIREDLDAVSDKVLMGDYQDAVEAVAEMMSLAPELRLRENAS